MPVNLIICSVLSFFKKNLLKKICVFTSLYIFIFTSFCFAQKERIDSLIKVLPSLKDTSRIDCLNQLSDAYILTTEKDSAVYYAGLAFKESEKLNYIHGIAISFNNKSRIAKHFDDDFIQSETLGKESLHWFEKTSNKTGIDNLYSNLRYTVFSQSKFDEAIYYTKEEYLIAQKNSDTSKMWDALQTMFSIYRESGDYEKSLSYIEEAQDLASASNNKIRISDGLYGMAQLYELIEDYPNALNYFRQVVKMDDKDIEAHRINNDYDIWFKMEFTEAFSHLHQFDSAWHYYHVFNPGAESIYYRVYLVSSGECYFEQKDYPKALQNFLQGVALHKKLNDRNQIMRTLLDVGKTYLALNNNAEALQYGREGLTIALQTKAKQFIRDGYKILYSVYDNLHQTDSAYFYYQKYMAMKDVVLSDQVKVKFAAYNYEQKIRLMSNEKLISRQQLKIQHQQLAQETIQKKILTGSIIGLILISGIIFRTIFLKRKNEKHRREIAENELQIQKLESQKQLSELEMQALRAQMNPHFIFNSLSSINLFILENNKLQASEYLSKFSRLIRLILQNSQEAYIPLEKELEALQLFLELESLRFENKFEYKVIVEKNIEPSEIKVAPLIIQPYVENAIWHGLMHKKENGHLEIELYLEEEILVCKITDDGIGRKKAAELKSKSTLTHKSMGMRITEDRIAMLQQQKQEGTFILINDLILPDGSPCGTEVLIKIPACYD